MLFQKRHKNAVKVFWTVASIIIILSMIALFGPVSPQTTQVRHRQPEPEERTVELEPGQTEVQIEAGPATEQ